MLIFAVIFVFAIKYRRRGDEVPQPIHGSLRLEITWSIIPFLVMLTFFWWGAKIYFANAVPPPDAMDVYVVGKQWMWKLQYPGGQREINELHVPIGRPVKITLASEDVIHSFFIPALRIKHDVVPGHYDTMWFTANKPGPLSLFCAEYCGTEHSGMVGWVTVMDPADYQNWLAGGGPPAPWRSRASACSSSWAAPPAICWIAPAAAARTCAAFTARASSSPAGNPWWPTTPTFANRF